MGFSIDFRYEDFYTGIIKDGFSIHLKSGVPLIEERRSKRMNEGIDITFSVSGIDELYSDFLTKPIEIIQPLREMPYGKEFYIADTDGYILAYLDAE